MPRSPSRLDAALEKRRSPPATVRLELSKVGMGRGRGRESRRADGRKSNQFNTQRRGRRRIASKDDARRLQLNFASYILRNPTKENLVSPARNHFLLHIQLSPPLSPSGLRLLISDVASTSDRACADSGVISEAALWNSRSRFLSPSPPLSRLLESIALLAAFDPAAKLGSNHLIGAQILFTQQLPNGLGMTRPS